MEKKLFPLHPHTHFIFFKFSFAQMSASVTPYSSVTLTHMVTAGNPEKLIAYINESQLSLDELQDCGLLQEACSRRQLGYLKALLDMGIEPRPYNSTTGNHPDIFFFVSYIDGLKMLLDRGESPNEYYRNDEEEDEEGEWLLDYAFQFGERGGCIDDLRCVRVLVDYGANEYVLDAHKDSVMTRIKHGRKMCSKVCTIVAGMKRVGSKRNGEVNVFRLMARHIWSTRITKHDKWENLLQVSQFPMK